MKDDILQLFVATESSRYALTEPFVRGGWAYATDGRALIRVKCSDPDDHGLFPPCEDIYAKLVILPDPATALGRHVASR